MPWRHQNFPRECLCTQGERIRSTNLQGENSKFSKLWICVSRNQPWIFIGRTDTEAPILCSPYVKSQLIGKDPDAGKDWRQEENGATEDELVGWHHWLNGYKLEQTPGDNTGQGSLASCSPRGLRARHDWETEQRQQQQSSKRILLSSTFFSPPTPSSSLRWNGVRRINYFSFPWYLDITEQYLMSPNYMLCARCIQLQKTSFNSINELLIISQ